MCYSCKTIEGVNRLYDELDIVCYQGIHRATAFGIVIPSIIIYSIGIPILGIVVIYRNRDALEKSYVK
jgi:hypothetical protein